jgi:hypothetical protein
LIFRKYYSTKPTGKIHIDFLNITEKYYKEKFGIAIKTIQMDNAPEYSKFNKTLADVKIEQTKEENELLKNLSTSVGQ